MNRTQQEIDFLELQIRCAMQAYSGQLKEWPMLKLALSEFNISCPENACSFEVKQVLNELKV